MPEKNSKVGYIARLGSKFYNKKGELADLISDAKIYNSSGVIIYNYSLHKDPETIVSVEILKVRKECGVIHILDNVPMFWHMEYINKLSNRY
jgi:hypothetical protein